VTILDETLQILQDHGALAGRRIRALHLTPYFTVVALDGDDVGACMSYYTLSPSTMETIGRRLADALAEDPLLLRWLWDGPAARCGDVPPGQERLVVTALKTAVLSALSAPILRSGGDAAFSVHRSQPFDPFATARRALVIGFGGYLDHLARTEHITELHVSDLLYDRERAKMEAAVETYRRLAPGKRITLSNGGDTRERLREADAVAITGSALANGTMEDLLQAGGPQTRVVVQGQSAAIEPSALYRRGVHLVATTLKPQKLVNLAAEDPSGEAMRPLLEGGLPTLYCAPRPASTHPLAEPA
jgi:hypothetical protein